MFIFLCNLMTAHIHVKGRGSLGLYGYADVQRKSRMARRRALTLASRDLGWLYVIRKLNALYVFNKYRNPSLAAAFKEDREYASAKHARLSS